uniref:Uncharacterized protein n=1 Tax=Knipowitschia caucasica TaxID=637954 RepID=A0AAV2J683_KNICA
MPYLTIYCKMFKRLQNMRSPRKRQGSVPQRGKAKKSLFDSDNTDADGTTHSFDSDCTIPLESHDDLSDDNQSAKCFSPERSSTPCSSKPVASKPKPRNDDKLIKSNISSVMPSTSGSSSSLVKSNDNAEVDSLKVQARHYKTLSAMYKKKKSNPNQSDVAQVLNLEFKARRAFIDSNVTPVPPKKMANASESLIHILKSEEDPALYLTKRPLFTPLLLFDGTTCIIAVGNEPICTLPKEDISEAMLVIMAYYYTLHLTYPKCVATVLSVIQTELNC